MEAAASPATTDSNMEDYLWRAKTILASGPDHPKVHAVLGGVDPGVDSVASTLSYAYFLNQKERSDCVCVPVLCGQGCDVGLPGETVRYLKRVRVCESALLWRDDINLLQLHHRGKLSLTLMRDDVLNSSDYEALESSILRVVHHHEQRAGEEGVLSMVMVVAREILQEAAEQICAPLGELLGEALRLQSEGMWIKDGHRSVDLEELLRALEERSSISPYDVTTGPNAGEAQLQGMDIEQMFLKELKEFSDEELTMSFTTVPVDLEDWNARHGLVGELKSFCHHHSYESLVIVSSRQSDPRHPCQQVAVYSDNSDILNQICCELEESASSSLGLEPVDCLQGSQGSQGSLQLYHHKALADSPGGLGPLVMEFLKEFMERRCRLLTCAPTSRTSSTEGVAGSAPLSQGSSGFTDMYGSDVERLEGPIAVAMPGDVGADLVSPDSGLATIRSSRSSKESSVFLSDDSPVAEAMAGGFLLNPALGFPSLSPIPHERRHSSRNRSGDNFELFSFDPLHCSNASPPAEDAVLRSSRGTGGHGSSSLSEFDELSMVDFYTPDSSAGHGGLVGSDLIGGGALMDQSVNRVPPTPVNSLVGSSTHSGTEVCFFPEDVAQRINGLQHKESVSSSEAWDDFGLDTKGSTSDDANTWSLTEAGFVCTDCPNPDIDLEGLREDKDSGGGRGEGDVRNAKPREEKDVCSKPVERQLTLVNEYIEPYETWNPDSGFTEPWQPVTLGDLQLTPPDEENREGKLLKVTSRAQSRVVGKKREALATLTPETSKEEEDGLVRKATELDFWTYTAQKGFLKSDSATSTTSVTTASYPESLDLWNMTIHEDSQSTLTTPDMADLSERSDSCGLPALGTSLESPLGVSSEGMDMWNTTIQEDSASMATSPEDAGTGREELTGMEPWEAEPGTDLRQQEGERRYSEEASPLQENVKRQAQRVQIVIKGDEGKICPQSGHDDHMMTENQITQDQIPGAMLVPVPNMVTSTSEYDNIGEGGVWSQPSSPDLQASPGTDTTELIQGQSSPFIAVLNPESSGSTTEHQASIVKGNSDYSGSTTTGIEQLTVQCSTGRQVFLFDGTSGLGHGTRNGQLPVPGGHSVESKYDNRGQGSEASEGPDWTEDLSSHSPFVLVDDGSSPTESDVLPLSHREEPVTELNFDQTWKDPATTQTQPSATPKLDSWDHLSTPVVKPGDSESPPNGASSLQWTTKVIYPDGGPHHMEDRSTMDAMSLSSSSGEKDRLKPSPDSLPPGSREDVRSNSDGDSSSGLEMDYIIVSGTVRESDRERKDDYRERNVTKDCDRGRREGSTSLETYSMLSYVATFLQSGTASHRHPEENNELNRHDLTNIDIHSPYCSVAGDNPISPIHTDVDHSTEANANGIGFFQSSHATNQRYSETAASYLVSPQIQVTTEISDRGQSDTNRSSLHKSEMRVAGLDSSDVDEDSYDGQTNAKVVKSSSASLRYPAEQHFFKAREEVYVHSQISLEDSDEGGLSPSAATCPSQRSQAWGSLLREQDDQQRQHAIPQSPLPLTDSSPSPLGDSSLMGTPDNQSGGPSPVQEVGLPFSGDLMDKEEEEFGMDPPSWDAGEEMEKGGCGVIHSHTHAPNPGPTDELLENSEHPCGGHFSEDGDRLTAQPMIDRFSQGQVDFAAEQPMRNQPRRPLQGLEDLLVNHKRGGYGDDFEEADSSDLGCIPTTANGASSPLSYTRLEDVATQPWNQQSSESVPHQWTASQDQANNSYTQYGYGHTDHHTHTDHPSVDYHETEDHAYHQTHDHAEDKRDDGLSQHYEAKGHTSTSYYYHTEGNGQDRSDDYSHYESEGQAHWEAERQDHSRTPEEPYDPTGNAKCLLEDHAHYETEEQTQYVPDDYAHFLLSRPASDDAGMMASNKDDTDGLENRPDPPSSLELNGASVPPRKKLVAPPMNVSLDRSEGSVLSDDAMDTPDDALDTGDDLDINLDELDTPDEADSLEFNGLGDPQGSNQETDREPSEAIPEYSAEEERQDAKLWRTVVIGEQEHRIDMKCIEPYQRVISHGGYYGDLNAIIVFAACFLPDSNCDDYHYVMENLFLYVISTLELMVAEDYMIVYLNGATPRRRMPGLGWMKKCYQMIDRRLRKNLKSFIIVHPSWFIRTVLGIIRPFISSKFSSKIKYVNSLAELRELIPMEYVNIPESIIKYEEERGIQTFACMRVDKRVNSGV
ncbi:uncharacterized protein LOC121550738 isoform X2 [Coregonus clupeaformis]|uniref:uncharacterized protein LOC121550738 isoform X2 n=1 Tax=Coregonus clupeaformis TaxID=59861 RepID=UPI001E1C3FF0|nr:uncharacterized protein LOC121550738 isoform X2 [Coregonus clupeaformis]